MSETRRRRSRVLEYFESRQAEPQEEQPQDEGTDPLSDLDPSFGLLQSGKESPSGE